MHTTLSSETNISFFPEKEKSAVVIIFIKIQPFCSNSDIFRKKKMVATSLACFTPCLSASAPAHSPCKQQDQTTLRLSFTKPSPRPSVLVYNRCRVSSFYRIGAVGRDLESVGVPTSVPVRVAHELLQAGHHYLDVRTPEEFSEGHAAGAINIPYMYKTGSGMVKNHNFLEQVLAKFTKDDEIIVGCQLGKRSLMAATDLLSAGFTGVTDIAGGYAAWTQLGLSSES